MKKPLLRSFTWLAFMTCVGAVQAAPIVTVDGRDWLQPSDFLFDYIPIRGACDMSSGVCSGSLGGYDMSGWTWAGIDDVNSLFNFYLGAGTLGPGADGVIFLSETGFPAPILEFFEDFIPSSTFEDGVISLRELKAFTREHIPVFNVSAPAVGSSFGFNFFGDAAYQAVFATGSVFGDVGPGGGWFYRDSVIEPPTSVPNPATALLLGLGLAGLWVARRRRTPQA